MTHRINTIDTRSQSLISLAREINRIMESMSFFSSTPSVKEDPSAAGREGGKKSHGGGRPKKSTGNDSDNDEKKDDNK